MAVRRVHLFSCFFITLIAVETSKLSIVCLFVSIIVFKCRLKFSVCQRLPMSLSCLQVIASTTERQSILPEPLRYVAVDFSPSNNVQFQAELLTMTLKIKDRLTVRSMRLNFCMKISVCCNRIKRLTMRTWRNLNSLQSVACVSLRLSFRSHATISKTEICQFVSRGCRWFWCSISAAVSLPSPGNHCQLVTICLYNCTVWLERPPKGCSMWMPSKFYWSSDYNFCDAAESSNCVSSASDLLF